MIETLPTLADVQEAAARICGHIRVTPLLGSPLLNERLGFRLLLKAECLQITGAFKLRGAFNNVLQLTDDEKKRGIVAMSAGNHAQGIAYAARKFGIPATILMPHDTPHLKVDNTRSYGATIQTYDRAIEDREAMGRAFAEKHGLRMVHSFDHPRTIAGQGTIGLEIFKQTSEIGVSPNAIIVNCSGGGLAAGIALSRDLYDEKPTLFTAEPEAFNDAQRSLTTGIMAINKLRSGSICDALLIPHLGAHNLPILMQHQAKGLTASDDDVLGAMHIASEHFKLTLEPGGAVGLATACLNRKQFQGQTIVVVASGGNIAPHDFGAMLQRGQIHSQRLLPQLKA